MKRWKRRLFYCGIESKTTCIQVSLRSKLPEIINLTRKERWQRGVREWKARRRNAAILARVGWDAWALFGREAESMPAADVEAAVREHQSARHPSLPSQRARTAFAAQIQGGAQ